MEDQSLEFPGLRRKWLRRKKMVGSGNNDMACGS